MRHWTAQEAKARFSEFLDTCLSEGPQIVTRRGEEAAVLVPLKEWQRLQQSARPRRAAIFRFPNGETFAAEPANTANASPLRYSDRRRDDRGHGPRARPDRRNQKRPGFSVFEVRAINPFGTQP
jgi:antitoxin Phd